MKCAHIHLLASSVFVPCPCARPPKKQVMGHSADRLATRFGVSRADQDAYAVRSHQNAASAHDKGLYDEEIIAAHGTTKENNVKADSNIEKLATLKPAFIKPHGTITPATSSPLTDGASAVSGME